MILLSLLRWQVSAHKTISSPYRGFLNIFTHWQLLTYQYNLYCGLLCTLSKHSTMIIDIGNIGYLYTLSYHCSCGSWGGARECNRFLSQSVAKRGNFSSSPHLSTIPIPWTIVVDYLKEGHSYSHLGRWIEIIAFAKQLWICGYDNGCWHL